MRRLELPSPNDSVTVTLTDGAQIVLRRHGRSDGPRLAVSHGNGLAADAYAGFWRLFCDTHDVIVFDIRNHGRNPLHERAQHTWDRIRLDLTEIRDHIDRIFGARPVTGLFHSLSAVSALRQTMAQGPLWERLFLFDPPLFPRSGHPVLGFHEEHLAVMTELARRRPETYASPEAFAATLKARRRFASWAPGTHELFATATLRQDENGGGWRLACPRDFEAHIFDTNRDATIWPALVAGLPGRMTFICGDPEMDDQDSPAMVCAALAQEADIDYAAVPGTTHLLQLEAPQACYELVMARLASAEAVA